MRRIENQKTPNSEGGYYTEEMLLPPGVCMGFLKSVDLERQASVVQKMDNAIHPLNNWDHGNN